MEDGRGPGLGFLISGGWGSEVGSLAGLDRPFTKSPHVGRVPERGDDTYF